MTDTEADILRYGVVLGAAAIFIGAIVGGEALRRRRLRRVAAASMPQAWAKILEENVPIYRRLPHSLKPELKRQLKLFLAERQFEGCGGLEMTDTIRITIAAQACVLVLGRKDGYRRTLASILVYPHGYVVPRAVNIGGGGHIMTPAERLGESWRYGAVVLAWDEVPQGPADATTGRNLVLHEFAHQLDTEDGFSDGVPVLDRQSDYDTWSRVLGARYAELRHAVEMREVGAAGQGGDEVRGPPAPGADTVLDPYGATDPAEFFAVATEAFFEKSDDLRHELPDLYDELRKYYRLDPAAWGRRG
jgi:MtfA peptidase